MTLAAHAHFTEDILARNSRAYLAAIEAQQKRKTATGTTEGSQRPFGWTDLDLGGDSGVNY